MPSNLLIGFPSIPYVAALSGSHTVDSSYPLTNLVNNSRAKHFRWSASQTSTYITADYGSAIGAEYFWIARADLVKAAGATECLLKRSSDNVTYTNFLGTTASLQTRTFSGRNSEDLVFTSAFNDDTSGANANTYRYWRLYINSAGGAQWRFSKWYAGSWFDFGRDPLYPMQLTKEIRGGRGRDTYHQFELSWDGVTDANAATFLTNVDKVRDVNPVFLYTSGYHDVLNNYRSLHCRILTVERTRPTTNVNKFRVSFEELI